MKSAKKSNFTWTFPTWSSSSSNAPEAVALAVGKTKASLKAYAKVAVNEVETQTDDRVVNEIETD